MSSRGGKEISLSRPTKLEARDDFYLESTLDPTYLTALRMIMTSSPASQQPPKRLEH